ncbi:RHS repeat-associated core domain-containing protein [uncultured Ilyobacter sp.]|uniref:RHS repeat-associated core domain-containing protein n=1 Tax=uncultured Ilyobacter sp. TaxID=544433 RepID=UPI0029F48FCB|nr:RHS repeat-associated core domain-containing protein [uncultured Ilyobacter sp.]
MDDDADGDFSDEPINLESWDIDDEWSAGYVGIYRGDDISSTHECDDLVCGIDNNGDGDYDDAGDDMLVSDDFNSNAATLSYDNAGNLTADGVYQFVYDAWNRLVAVQFAAASDTTTIAAYEYDGKNRRLTKAVSNRGDQNTPNDGGDTTVHFYYCGTGLRPMGRWNICETRNGSNQTTFQYLWGTRYTDELVSIEKNGDVTESNDTTPDEQSGESTADSRYFVHQDRNWNVTALSEYDPSGTNNARIVERYAYTPYGTFTVLAGDSGSGELGTTALTSTVGNPFAHQGLPFDAEKAGYQNRWREYAGGLQRFAQRDPLTSMNNAGGGYQDGASLYEYVRSMPTAFIDPSGRICWEEFCWCLLNPICCETGYEARDFVVDWLEDLWGG